MTETSYLSAYYLALNRDCVVVVAEREGFEPPVRLHVLRISSAARSTTLPPLRRTRRRGVKPRRGVGAPLSMARPGSQGALPARQQF